MRQSRISVLASVAAGATLALAEAAGGTPWSPASRNSASTYDMFQVPHTAPAYHTSVSIPTNMRMVEVLTSLGICKNNAERTPAGINTTRSTSAGARTKQSANRAVPDLVHWWGTPVDQTQPPLNPTTVDISSTSVSDGTAASSWASPVTMPLVPRQAVAGHDTGFHDNSEEEDQQGSKSRQKPPLPPNQFLTRFYIVLQYIADVIKADDVCTFLFGRWAQRYYQRIRKNQADRRRRRSLRRWSRLFSRMCLVLRDAMPLNRIASSTVHTDGGDIVTERPSAAEVDMMPPAGDSDATSSLARGSAIGLVAQPTTEASLASKPPSTATGHEEGTAVCAPSPEVSGGTTPTAGNAGDVTTQHASRQFIGWEDIGREAYYEHSREVSMSNIYDFQDFHSYERKGCIFMAGFSSGLGIEKPSRSYMCGQFERSESYK